VKPSRGGEFGVPQLNLLTARTRMSPQATIKRVTVAPSLSMIDKTFCNN
jgi:hypothetical protein